MIRLDIRADGHGTTQFRGVVGAELTMNPLADAYADCGDMAGSAGPDASEAQWLAYEGLENVLRRVLTETVHAPGDHDGGSRWLLHRGQKNRARWLGLDVACISLDCFDWCETQTAWFMRELDAARMAGVRHILIFTHKPPYSTGSGGVDDQWFRENLHELCVASGVRAVFAGHLHAFEHALVDGIHYVTCGVGGGTLYPEAGWLPTQPWSLKRLTGLWGFVRLNVDGAGCEMQVIKAAPGAVAEAYKVRLAQ